ncbi:DUF4258 domain-containing protein [Candidatus Woesearchaeota archaeon]|nr:DUF4258 domain-containing protein [Candidatus Woesearchaeota archaeon]
MKKVIFSQHALLRMLERDFNEKTVLYVIQNPDFVRKSYSERKIVIKRLNGKIVHVILIEKESFIKIITVY